MKIQYTLLFAFLVLFFTNCEKQPSPGLLGATPDFGPAGTLVTFEGENLDNILEMKFSDQIINFNTAYNSDNALLLRIPENVALGEHVVTIETEGGTATTNFTVTLEPPAIFDFLPESASVGEEVTITGKNFFEPVEVYFFDSIQAEIVTLSETEIKVIVPDGVERGFIKVKANGGLASSPVKFFSTNVILINDFDGNGVRSATNNWIFVGSIDQNANTAIQNMNPDPFDGNFVKITGFADNWIGGFQNHSWDIDDFPNFGITTGNNNTLFEMDVNTNGNEFTHILVIFLERDGSFNDFTAAIELSGSTEWERLSIPLNRFKDLNEILVDPAKIHTVKVHLINEEGVNSALEVNVDNMQFVEIL